MPTSPLSGRFCWYELMTDAPAEAVTFYCAVVGYETTVWEERDYTMFAVGEATVGGVVALSDEAKAQGARPQWVPYIGHADVDALQAQVEERGGVTRAEPFDLPGVGRFALFQDPHGAAFAGFAPEDPERIDVETRGPGFISWHELASDDLEEAWAFYTALFPWVAETPEMNMGPGGVYRLYRAEGMGSDLGGVYKKMPGSGRARWGGYITVQDLDAAVGRVSSEGGEVLQGPLTVPGGDRVAQCRDPQGAIFWLHCAAVEEDLP